MLYGNGQILKNHNGYTHWICINGFRQIGENIEFRYEDTITQQRAWVSSQLNT